MDRNVTLICAAADRDAAEALASQFPGGAGTFSVRLTTTPGGSVPTHYAGSGFVNENMAAAFEVNIDPMYKVFDNTDADFNSLLDACVPPLFRVVDTEAI